MPSRRQEGSERIDGEADLDEALDWLSAELKKKREPSAANPSPKWAGEKLAKWIRCKQRVRLALALFHSLKGLELLPALRLMCRHLRKSPHGNLFITCSPDKRANCEHCRLLNPEKLKFADFLHENFDGQLPNMLWLPDEKEPGKGRFATI
jgi:hypothetical protein